MNQNQGIDVDKESHLYLAGQGQVCVWESMCVKQKDECVLGGLRKVSWNLWGQQLQTNYFISVDVWGPEAQIKV